MKPIILAIAVFHVKGTGRSSNSNGEETLYTKIEVTHSACNLSLLPG
ncbi:hypothetical protein [Paenibacillus alkalitolerans]|nr:hypothetical protein [Paenibacillus alkalitolerans]